MPSTLLLDPQTWDLTIDATLNIAKAAEPYALAQDAGSAAALFQGEDYYDTTRGVPYWEQILGHYPPVSVMKSLWIAAALTVPDVKTAASFISGFVDRRIITQLLVTGANGQTAAISLSRPLSPPAP